MLVVYASYCSERTKGYLSRFLLEVAPVVFVGVVTARLRDDLITYLEANLKPTENITIMWATNTAQGYKIIHFAAETRIVDVDGVYLVNKPVTGTVTEEDKGDRIADSNLRKDWSNASRRNASKKWKRR